MMKYNTIIIGGGTAGLFFSAITPTNKKTLLIDHNTKLGVKLLMSGNGQCNITHSGSIKDFINKYGNNGKYIRKILYKHSNVNLVNYIKSLGIPLTTKENGKVFPASMDSRQIVNSLIAHAKSNGVDFQLGRKVISITNINNQQQDLHINTKHINQYEKINNTNLSTENTNYEIKLNNGDTYLCENLVIACGGLSYPKTGSDGSIVEILNQNFTLEWKKQTPALCPVFVDNYNFSDLSGISINNVILSIKKKNNDKITYLSKEDSLLFTHKNLSGPLILNSSRHIDAGDTILINFLPSINRENFTSNIKLSIQKEKISLSSYLSRNYKLPKRFIVSLLKEISLENAKLPEINSKQLKTLMEKLFSWSFTCTSKAGFNQAMVTAGGLDISQINLSTMESNSYKNLFFIGEILDIDGDTGGYNIQFAYSSAMASIDKIYS